MPVLRQIRAPWIVLISLGLALFGASAYAFVAFSSASEFTQPEGIVATQIRYFSQTGALYFDLRQYPYTVCAYMPVFYGAVGALLKVGLPVFVAGRLVSILAFLALVWLAGRLVRLYGAGRDYQWLAIGLAGTTQILLGWGTVGQVDMLAIALSLASFHQFARFEREGAETLDRAALLALAGLLTKQTALIAPAIIFLLLLKQSPRRAFRFGTIAGGAGLAIVLALNFLLDGRFLANTLFANLNPFALYKLQLPLEYVGIVLSGLLVVVAAGASAAWRDGLRSPFLYLGLASLWFLFSSAKVGADSNYLIESSVLLVVCACLGLSSLHFFELSRSGSRTWVTLLILPLSIFLVQNARVGVSAIAKRLERESQFAAQVDKVKPYVTGQGRVLSTDSNLLVHAGRSLEVEVLIYRLLVEAGRIDQAPLLSDIDRGAFDTIVLYEDLEGKRDPDPEIPRLTPEQMLAVARRYELVKQAPGPNLAGLYVYQPRQIARQQ